MGKMGKIIMMNVMWEEFQCHKHNIISEGHLTLSPR